MLAKVAPPGTHAPILFTQVLVQQKNIEFPQLKTLVASLCVNFRLQHYFKDALLQMP